MKVSLFKYSEEQLVQVSTSNPAENKKAQLVLCFACRNLLEREKLYNKLHYLFPNAQVVINSTAGEITGSEVSDGGASITAIEFEKAAITCYSINMEDCNNNSREAGKTLALRFADDDQLQYILLLSDGARVNGSELVKGLNQHLRRKVPVTGGLAGDGDRFDKTLVGLNQEPGSGNIVAIGISGSSLLVSYGSMGGFEFFGPQRVVTRSKGNQVFEINQEPALQLYKKYLGPYAAELPSSALLFPLSVTISDYPEPVVRTILSIDQESQSMIFAGDIPEGSKVRFMKSNFDKLVEGAEKAACLIRTKNDEPQLAILVSCVGRKLMMNNRIEEEVEAVQDVLGKKTAITGFYSYGELSPTESDKNCVLHNQTITITTISEL